MNDITGTSDPIIHQGSKNQKVDGSITTGRKGKENESIQTTSHLKKPSKNQKENCIDQAIAGFREGYLC